MILAEVAKNREGDVHTPCWQLTVINVVLGAVLVLLCGLVAAELRQWLEQRRVRHALAAELASITNLQLHRGHLERLQAHIAKVKECRTVTYFQLRLEGDYDIVFRANAGRIGSLPGSLASRVVIAYYRFTAVRDDLQLLNDAARGQPGTEWLSDIDQCIQFHERVLSLADNAFGLMDSAEKKLRRVDYRGWPIRPASIGFTSH